MALATILFGLAVGFARPALALPPVGVPGAPVRLAALPDLPCTPETEYLESVLTGADLDFCERWNPEFAFLGHRCCAPPRKWPRRKRSKCSPRRFKASYCDEMTEEQRFYAQAVQTGQVRDVLGLLASEIQARKTPQAWCGVNNGFLAHGRRLIPTSENRIRVKTPARCVDFGTDRLVAMLEWVGRKIGSEYGDPEYSQVRLVVGDLSAPKGGCLTGKGGRRGHSSHMSGEDADLGFLKVRGRGVSDAVFTRDFDPQASWWLVRQIFSNPYACVKVLFLDRRLISKMARVAKGDPLWPELSRFVRHVRGHRNHIHVRVGPTAGPPGCVPGANPDDEALDEDADDQSGEDALPEDAAE